MSIDGFGLFGNSSGGLPSVNLLEDGVSIQAPTEFDEHANAPKKVYLGDDTWKFVFPNGDQLKVRHGLTLQSIQHLGNNRTIRNFNWSRNTERPDEEASLSTIEVVKREIRYLHARVADGSWQKKTWSKQLGCWSEPEREERSFYFDNETFTFKFVDASDGMVHIILPGGIQRAITPEGITSEYVNGRLERISNSGLVRVLSWNRAIVVSLNDGVQNKFWKLTADGVWTSDQGDRRFGQIIFKLNGAFGFKGEDTTTFIDMSGREHVVNNE